jgi:hypothetical protein
MLSRKPASQIQAPGWFILAVIQGDTFRAPHIHSDAEP